MIFYGKVNHGGSLTVTGHYNVPRKVVNLVGNFIALPDNIGLKLRVGTRLKVAVAVTDKRAYVTDWAYHEK